jgi:hypothetical protein
MSDDELMDTIASAVESQKEAAVEPGPQIKAPEPDKPAEEAKEHVEERAERDPSGRFLPKAAKPVEEKEHAESVEAVDKSGDEEKADISRPPKRLPIRTKGIWQTLSEPLREDIIAREVDFDKAFKRYDGLGPFAMEAEKNGTNLVSAFRSYVDLEDKCRKDPLAGIETLANTLNWNQKALAYAMAAKHGIVTIPQAEQPKQEGMPTKAELLAEVRAEREQERINEQIETFKEDPRNIYFEDVRPEMARLVTSGLATSLKDAYDKACRLHPEIARLNGSAAAETGQASKAAAASQARKQAKAIGGAPSHGSNAGRETPDDGNQSVFDTVRAAVNRQRG